jgi:hypothetical protein
MGPVTVAAQQLKKIPKEYVDSLKAFTDVINQQFKDNNVPSHKLSEVQRNVDDFSRELEGIKSVQEPDVVKKTNLKSKLVNIVKAAFGIHTISTIWRLNWRRYSSLGAAYSEGNLIS